MGGCCGKKKKGGKNMFGMGGDSGKDSGEGEAVPGMVQQVNNKQELQSVLEAAGDSLVVVDFYATWCGPCKTIKPKVDELAVELKQDKVFVVNVDLDESAELKAEYGISSMPTFILFKNAEKVDMMTGTNLEQLKEIIETNK